MSLAFLSRYLQAAFETLFPRRCAECGETLGADEQHLCAACLTRLPLARITRYDDNAIVRLFFDLPGIQRATGYLSYRPDNIVAHLIGRLKYHDRPAIGEHLGQLAAHHLETSDFLQGIDALVPVPLARQKQRKRGYNQSEAIARGLSAVTGIPVRTDLVKRVVNNPTQTRLSTDERRRNVESIFALTDADAIHALGSPTRPPHLLLVDDVLTTGATLHSLAATLSTDTNIHFSVFALSVAGTHLNVFEHGAE